MIRTTLNWTVKNLKSMNDEKHTLDFFHPIQRQSGQWDGDRLKKSLLIHSILAGYPVPPIYCLKEAIGGKDYSYSILDGKQRLITTFDYIDGRYPLDTETPSVAIDGITYELGGKYFTDLNMECQQELLRFKFVIYGFEDADDDLIEEIFFRLNNSAPLTKPQKSMALTGVQNASFIKSILSDKFFSEICQFSALQRRKSDDMCTLLQSMMLLDNRYYGYEYSSISADETMRYAASIKNNYSDGQKERLFNVIDYLEKAFPVQDKMLKKINIPVVMLVADTAMGDTYNTANNIYRVGPMYFRQWFFYFFNECYDDYKMYCSSGSIKKEKTQKRIEIMEQSFREYFELENDADTKQAAMETSLSGEDVPPENTPLKDSFPLQETASVDADEQNTVLTETTAQNDTPTDNTAKDSILTDTAVSSDTSDKSAVQDSIITDTVTDGANAADDTARNDVSSDSDPAAQDAPSGGELPQKGISLKNKKKKSPTRAKADSISAVVEDTAYMEK